MVDHRKGCVRLWWENTSQNVLVLLLFVCVMLEITYLLRDKDIGRSSDMKERKWIETKKYVFQMQNPIKYRFCLSITLQIVILGNIFPWKHHQNYYSINLDRVSDLTTLCHLCFRYNLCTVNTVVMCLIKCNSKPLSCCFH